MIKYGILSTASIVERYVNGIRHSKNGEVYAIASRTIEKARTIANQLNINTYYGTYEKLYEDENIDVIYIPTVNAFHYRDAKNALMHHKHVIVEKPFTLTYVQAKELFQIAKENNVFLMEAQKSVFLPTSHKVKELLSNNCIGDLYYIELRAGFPSRFTYDHWMYDLSMGGGALYGSATYTIELLKYLLDNPKIDMTSEFISCVTGSDEICHFTLNLDNKYMAVSTIAMNIPLENEAVFYGTKGRIRVKNYWKADCVELIKDRNVETFQYPTESEFTYEIDHINSCIENNLLTSTIMSEEITCSTVKLVEDAYNNWLNKR